MGLLHPVLMILFVYPVVGATIRLGILAREKRLNINPIADTVPVEHAQHGAWVTGGVLVAVLIGLGHSLWSSPISVLLKRSWPAAVSSQRTDALEQRLFQVCADCFA